MIKTEMRPVKPHGAKTIKVAELNGPMLDRAVAKALGITVYKTKRGEWMTLPYGEFNHRQGIPYWRPRIWWSQGGPIIEDEKIGLGYAQGQWCAWMPGEEPRHYDKYPLFAAMRCFVVSRLGNEVEVEG